MRFDKYYPSEKLKPYIRYMVVTESLSADTYKVFPSTGLVAGFQFKGKLSLLQDGKEVQLSTSGISGVADSYKVFHHSAGIATVLVYFSEMGLASFTHMPVHELFNQSVGLEHLFSPESIAEVEEKLAAARTDRQRLAVIERFLLLHIKKNERDALVAEAVKKIYAAKGHVRIKELSKELCTSQSPLEKRFRKLVGTTPKKFASIVRFNTILDTLGNAKSLTDICYENNFFDQAHFIKDFKQYTGETPENFKRFL